MSDATTVSLAPAKQDLILFRGGSVPILYQLDKSTDGGKTWTALDLTGYTGIEIVGYDISDPTNELFTWDETHGQLVVDRPLGQIQLSVAQDVVGNFDFDRCGYYFRLTDDGGATSGITGGFIRLTWQPVAEIGQGVC